VYPAVPITGVFSAIDALTKTSANLAADLIAFATLPKSG